jgi:hypothetical protein
MNLRDWVTLKDDFIELIQLIDEVLSNEENFDEDTSIISLMFANKFDFWA